MVLSHQGEHPANQSFLIGIGGGTGSGKSYVTECIVSHYGREHVAVVDYDSYYRDESHLTFEARSGQNFDHPKAIDHDLLYSQMRSLAAGKSIQKPVYDFTQHLHTSSFTTVCPAPLIILEGIFALWDQRIRALMQCKVFVHADDDLRFIRRLKRDVVERGRSTESVISQYLESVRPMHLAHVEPTRHFADLVVENSAHLDVKPILDAINTRAAHLFRPLPSKI